MLQEHERADISWSGEVREVVWCLGRCLRGGMSGGSRGSPVYLVSSKERKKDATAGKGSSMKNGQHGCMCLHLSGERNGWSIRVTGGA